MTAAARPHECSGAQDKFQLFPAPSLCLVHGEQSSIGCLNSLPTAMVLAPRNPSVLNVRLPSVENLRVILQPQLGHDARFLILRPAVCRRILLRRVDFRKEHRLSRRVAAARLVNPRLAD
jgi:hypothetical protein